MACLFQKIVSFDKESYFCIETINIKLSFHSMNFVEELKWRGMVHTMMPGTEELFEKGIVTAYLGIDPTADSLHIGHLCGVMMLRHFQRCGHKPIAVLGGALSKFLDFDSDAPNHAELVNNYDWMKDFSFLDFARTVGKHITVNYMMAKDSVQKRLNGEARDGLSFTEFTYQLLQGYDFLHLYETKNCKLQLGGSDQWGNITTGAELIRRTNGGEVFALTCPLVTKADGTKFGKTESGNVWLDARYTSPYKFYQFWLNVSDEDAKRYIKIFTSISKEEIEALSAEHDEAPHLRVLQKRLAKEVTVMVHSEADYEAAVEASNILFGNSTSEQLHKLDEDTLLAVFEGVPQFEISRNTVLAGIPAVELTTEVAAIFPSKGEMRKLTQGGGVSINKEKLAAPDTKIDATYLLNNKYIIVQRGKKNYYLLIAK